MGRAGLLAPHNDPQRDLANAAVVRFYERLGYAVEDRINLGKSLPPA